MNLQRAVFKVELEKQKAEKAAHARYPKLPYFDESKKKMYRYLSRFEKYATEKMGGRGMFGRLI